MHESISLCDTLDRVLNKGVVASGEIMISVAGVDLIYINLALLLSSVAAAQASHQSHRSYGSHMSHMTHSPMGESHA